ncbi:hypothetical protein J4226_02015 [Candidatus Pacearchaeota archaeon]|nr:hypothetical protein [Candidatus Pacearchaeota archaeon]
MNIKNNKLIHFFLYFILITILGGFWLRGFKDTGFFILGLICILIINYRYYIVYGVFVNSKDKISRGLLFSLIFAIFLLVVFFQIDTSYEIVDGDTTYHKNYDFELISGLYFLSAAFCFLVDSFFNRKTKDVERWKIFIGSIMFYGIYLALNFILFLILNIMQAFTFS